MRLGRPGVGAINPAPGSGVAAANRQTKAGVGMTPAGPAGGDGGSAGRSNGKMWEQEGHGQSYHYPNGRSQLDDLTINVSGVQMGLGVDWSAELRRGCGGGRRRVLGAG